MKKHLPILLCLLVFASTPQSSSAQDSLKYFFNKSVYGLSVELAGDDLLSHINFIAAHYWDILGIRLTASTGRVRVDLPLVLLRENFMILDIGATVGYEYPYSHDFHWFDIGPVASMNISGFFLLVAITYGSSLVPGFPIIQIGYVH